MIKFKIKSTILLFFSVLIIPSVAFSQKDRPVYLDSSASTTDRVNDLINRMTLEEKIGQISTELGWEMYSKQGDSVVVSDKFKTSILKRHIGSFWATFRADPWTKKTLTNGLNPYLAAQTANALQRYILENSRLKIPVFLAEECPHGHMAIGTTVFPTAIGQSSTWNPALIEQMASTIAMEARLQGAHIGYGPILDLAREPRWSRVEETYGEDPVLNSIMGVAMVKGFQGNNRNFKSGRNLISTLKHFTAYGVPEGGHNGGYVSVGMRELHQSYLRPFKAAIEAGAASVMTAYNSIDGIPCSANPYLLTNVLRDQWGFKGFTVSDLGSIDALVHAQYVAESGVDAATMAINAGLNNDLGAKMFAQPLLEAVKQSKVDVARIDEAVANILTLKFEMGLFENPFVDPNTAGREVRSRKSIELAKQVAQESVILLKNQDGILPFRKTVQTVAVIGPNADNIYNQLGDYTAPQDEGNVVTVLKGIQTKFPNARVRYVKGTDIRDTTTSNIDEAVKAAAESELTILVLGGSSARDFKTEYISTGAALVTSAEKEKVSDMESGEGYDRKSLDMMGRQLDLLKAVVNTGKPVILVVIAGRPLNLNWASENVPAILQAWYPGQEGGNAIADIVFGDYNPAGRLPISIPRSTGQLPVYYNYKNPVKHSYVEGSADPLYPFGFGMSYSDFAYSDLKVASSEEPTVSVKVTLNVKNLSKIDGEEVVQVYLKDKVASVAVPNKQLVAFRRIKLKANETKVVAFELTEDDLMLFDQWINPVVEAGSFQLMIGSSSTDIRLSSDFDIKLSTFVKP